MSWHGSSAWPYFWQWSCDCEIGNSLSFLDAKVSRKDNKFITSVYRMSTFTGLGTSFWIYLLCPVATVHPPPPPVLYSPC